MTSSEEIKIRDFEGFKISYAQWRKQFVGRKGEVEIGASDEETLQAKIKKHNAELRRFKPMEAIKVYDLTVGRITSRAADDEQGWIYFSYKEDNQSTHSKEFIGHYDPNCPEDRVEPKFVEVTEKNLQIMTAIKKEEETIVACENVIRKLKGQFEKPVTLQTLKQAAGEKKS